MTSRGLGAAHESGYALWPRGGYSRLATPHADHRRRLMLGGFLLNTILTAALHPSGEEDDHPAIFTEYADSSTWIAVHLGQFIGVLVTLSGLLVLYRVLRATERSPLVAQLAAAAAVATAAIWAVLQGLDGVGLKQAVDSWVSASGRRSRSALPTPRPCAGWSGGSRATSASCSG